MESPSFFERFNQWSRNSVGLKLIAIGILILILLIPSFMIQSVVRERQFRSTDVKNEITSKWGQSQNIIGPVLSVPYIQYTRDTKGVIVSSSRGYTHFLPENLKIEGQLNPDILSRSIYDVVVYTADLKVKGNFVFPKAEELNLSDFSFGWEDAMLSVGISDMKGVSESLIAQWDGKEYAFNPGVGNIGILNSGISVNVPINDSDLKKEVYDFSVPLKLKGSQWLSFEPVGKNTTATLASSWANPSFDGGFLPVERSVTEDGFTASWSVLNFNRSYPQQWVDAGYSFSEMEGKGGDYFYNPYSDDMGEETRLQQSSAFGVNLLMPVETYQKNMRAVKYAVMTLFLTFLTFFFSEVLEKKRIHPIQYLLMGFAICLFYLLLLSLSEYINFSAAYFVGTVATAGLITAYSQSVFHNRRHTMLVGGVLLVLYGFFYSLLQLQDYALLMGSFGLFGILALVMYLSRKLDWYNLGGRKES